MTEEQNNDPRRIQFSEEQIEEIEKLSAVLSQTQLADFFGITDRGFRKVMERDEKVRSAYKRGRAKAVGSVASSLLASAKKGNTTAQIFYLKTQAGWRETAADHAELPPLTINVVDGTPK